MCELNYLHDAAGKLFLSLFTLSYAVVRNGIRFFEFYFRISNCHEHQYANLIFFSIHLFIDTIH